MVALVLAGSLGCTGAKSPEGSDFVHWEESVAEDNPRILPTFEALARGYGCKVSGTETSVVGLCGQEGDIVLRKDGRTVVVGCKRVEGLHACRALFGRIVDKPGS
jgi:hypothetical protein